jgi:hypothetical protein
MGTQCLITSNLTFTLFGGLQATDLLSLASLSQVPGHVLSVQHPKLNLALSGGF